MSVASDRVVPLCRLIQDVSVVGTIERATRFAPPVAQSGPMAAVAVLARVNDSQHEWSIWLEEARLHAVLGSCRSSIKSVKSGIRCFVAFIGAPSSRCALQACLCIRCLCRCFRLEERH